MARSQLRAGSLAVTPNTGALNAHLNLWMAAGGLRGTLMDGGGTGLTLTGVTDALVVVTSSVRAWALRANCQRLMPW